MSPSYFLFILQLNDKFQNIFEMNLNLFGFSIKTNIYWVGVFILVVTLTSTLFLRLLLIKQYKNSSTDQVLGGNKKNFSSSELEERNGGVIPFLLGNILPTVVVVGDKVSVTIFMFLILQFLLFVLIISFVKLS